MTALPIFSQETGFLETQEGERFVMEKVCGLVDWRIEMGR